MIGCPNSSESGCRCPEHHPGLGYQDAQPVVIHLVTTGPPEPSADELVDRAMQQWRIACAACGGDADRCRAGAGAPTFARLKSCAAFSPAGELALRKAPPQPRQPWEARPVRRAA